MATPNASIAAPPTTCSDQSTAKPKRAAGGIDDAPRGGDDLRPDAVARDRRDAVRRSIGAVGHGRVSPWRGATNATETPLISAPWSLLTATR